MNLKPVLLLSVAANIVLVGAVGYFAASRGKISNDLKSDALLSDNATRSTAKSVEKDSAAPTSSVITNRVVQTIDWRSVESEDYRKYIANLRAIGCPEETIRDIITADVNKLYESKRKELAGPKKKFEFWKPGALMGAVVDPERTEKERALNKEKRALLTELLGVAPDDKPEILAGVAGQLEAMFDFLPADKRSKVFDLMQDMQGKMQKSMKGGAPDPEDIRKAMKETEAAIAGILSPEEMQDYNLRFSMTANAMRMQMAGFEPTEQEFLDIFKARKAYDDEYGGGFGGVNPSMTKEEKEKAAAAKKELDAQIKSTLGDERYADYERGQDWNYQQIYRIADRNGLGKDGANKVYDMKKVAEDEAKKIRDNKSLTSEQRTAALQGIRTETENSIHAVFGDKGWKSYENQAHWLNNISPKPKAEPGGATAQ